MEIVSHYYTTNPLITFIWILEVDPGNVPCVLLNLMFEASRRVMGDRDNDPLLTLWSLPVPAFNSFYFYRVEHVVFCLTH